MACARSDALIEAYIHRYLARGYDYLLLFVVNECLNLKQRVLIIEPSMNPPPPFLTPLLVLLGRKNQTCQMVTI